MDAREKAQMTEYDNVLGLVPAERIGIAGGEIEISTASPPTGLVNRQDLGLLLNESMIIQRLHAQAPPNNWVGEVRAIVTPGGDYGATFTAGEDHYSPASGTSARPTI